MIHGRGTGASGFLLLSAASLAVLSRMGAPAQQDEDVTPYQIVGLGEQGPVSWPSPPFSPDLDCHHEFHNAECSCEVIEGCLRRDGIDLLLNDTGQELPFWYSGDIAHKFGGLGALVALDTIGPREFVRLMDFLMGHFHRSYLDVYDPSPSGQLTAGVTHGANWFTVGTQAAFGYKDGVMNPWPHIEQLCPMPKSSTTTRAGKGTLNSLLDSIATGCLHGIGHGGIVAGFTGQGNSFYPCTDVGHVDFHVVLKGAEGCDLAPSPLIKMWCYVGFYHGTIEHHDHVKDKLSWMWPCDQPSLFREYSKTGTLSFPEQCFNMLFTVIGQRWSVNMPGADQIAPSNPATLALWGQRLLGMEMAWDNAEAAGLGPYGICTSTNAPEEAVQSCIDAFSASGSGSFPMSGFSRKTIFKNFWKYDMVEMCTSLVAPSNTKFVESMWNSTMERRWFACVGGIAHIEAAEIQCDSLLTVQGQPESLRVRAFNLCQLTSDDTYIPAHSGTPASKRRTMQWDWEWWKKSDMVNLYPSNNWTGAGPGYSFLEPYSTSPLASKPFREFTATESAV